MRFEDVQGRSAVGELGVTGTEGEAAVANVYQIIIGLPVCMRGKASKRAGTGGGVIVA